MVEVHKNKGTVNPATGRELISWQAHEYEYYEKGTDWYWWVGLFAVILFGIAVWEQSFLFAMLVLVGWFTIVIYAMRPPLFLRYAICERGLLIGNTLYFWHDLKSFWIFYNPPLHKELSIESRRAMMPHIKISLADADPVDVRDALIKFLPEIEQPESLIDNLSRLARF